MLSKRSQVQIFLRYEEEGQRVRKEREKERERGTGGERVKKREEETEECRKKVLAKEKERVGMDLCIPLGVKR